MVGETLMDWITNPAFLALIGTIFGGAGLKIVEKVLNKDKVKSDIATEIRNELRGEVGTLRDELRRVETELDDWKAKYYELLDQFYRRGIKPDDPKADLRTGSSRSPRDPRRSDPDW